MTLIIHTGGNPGSATPSTWLPPVDYVTNDEAAPPVDGIRYIVGPVPAGAFAAFSPGDLIEYEDSTASYILVSTNEDDAVIVNNANTLLGIYEDGTGLVYKPGMGFPFEWRILPDDLWYDDRGVFTNLTTIQVDSVLEAYGDLDPAGSGVAAAIGSKRALAVPGGDPNSELFNLLRLLNGGPSGTEVCRFTPDGHFILRPNLAGEYVWEDLVSDGVTVVAGASLPPVQVYRGGIEMRHWAVGDQGNLNFHFKHAWAPGTPGYVHIHGKLRTGTIGTTAKIKFELEYIKGQAGAVDSAPLTPSKEFDISNLAQYTEVILSFDPITMTGYAESSNLTCRIRRIAASANEYADLLAIPEIDCHHQREKMGSRNQLPPFGK